MVLFIGLLQIFFLSIFFTEQNPLHFFLTNVLSVGIFFLGLYLLFFRSRKISVLLRFFSLSLLSFFLSFALLVGIAWAQLNTYALLFTTHPEMLGVVTDADSVASAIKANALVPQVVFTQEQHKALLTLATATSGSNNFYGTVVLPFFPQRLVQTIKLPASGIVFLDNTLVVTDQSAVAFEKISPVLGYLLVKQYFPEKRIKSLPKVIFMSEHDYLNYRGQEENKKMHHLDEQEGKLDDAKRNMAASIETDKSKIEANKQALIRASLQRNTVAIGQLNKNIRDWNQRLENDKALLEEYSYYSELFKKQKVVSMLQKKNILNEFGVFEPKDSIKVPITAVMPRYTKDITFTAYFETLTHEYLHYASYISEEKKLKDGLFEEGITEYFARAVIHQDLHKDTNFGYPVYVKIITQMTELLPESELAEIYFTKDQEGLERALNRVYGDNFYQNNEVFFQALQYTSDSKQLLQLANGIMKKIGGKPLEEKDLESSL